MSFKELLKNDISSVFLNEGEFAQRLSLKINGRAFHGIPVVKSTFGESRRESYRSDKTEGLYKSSTVLFLELSSLEGECPEQGQRIFVEENTFGEAFYKAYKVESCSVEAGLLKLVLDAVDE